MHLFICFSWMTELLNKLADEIKNPSKYFTVKNHIETKRKHSKNVNDTF